MGERVGPEEPAVKQRRGWETGPDDSSVSDRGLGLVRVRHLRRVMRAAPGLEPPPDRRSERRPRGSPHARWRPLGSARGRAGSARRPGRERADPRLLDPPAAARPPSPRP